MTVNNNDNDNDNDNDNGNCKARPTAVPLPSAPTEDHLPVAFATQVSASPAASTALTTTTTTSTSTTIAHKSPYITVTLPVGSTDSVIFTGSNHTVQIGKIDPSFAQSHPQLQVGLYLHSIHILPDGLLQVSHFGQHAAKVQQLLAANSQMARQLILAPGPPAHNNPNDGFYYTHTLPMGATLENLQLELEGFPPRIKHVGSQSPMAGKLHPGLVIVELRFPNHSVVNQTTPGFTAFKVKTELQTFATSNTATSSNNNDNVVLVVKEELVRVKNEKGSSAAFDDCIVM